MRGSDDPSGLRASPKRELTLRVSDLGGQRGQLHELWRFPRGCLWTTASQFADGIEVFGQRDIAAAPRSSRVRRHEPIAVVDGQRRPRALALRTNFDGSSHRDRVHAVAHAAKADVAVRGHNTQLHRARIVGRHARKRTVPGLPRHSGRSDGRRSCRGCARWRPYRPRHRPGGSGQKDP